MNTPLISVIVPVYNVASYLPQCLKSIVEQTYAHLEIIVVDDGSTDSSGSIADEWAANDARISVIHKRNGGLSDARNAALDVATGEFVTFIDSDDYVSKDFADVLVGIAINHDADIAVCDWEKFNDKEQPVAANNGAPTVVTYAPDEAILNIFYQHTITNSHCSRLFRRSLFENLRYPVGRLYEDLALTIPIFRKANRVVYTTQEMYFYRQNREGSIIATFSMRRADVLDILSALEVQAEQEFPQYLPAIRSRHLSAYFNMLRLVPLDDEQYQPLIEKCWEGIKQLRASCLKDIHVRKQNKAAILISYCGLKTLLKSINNR